MGRAFAPFVPGGDGPLQKAMSLNLPRERFDDRRDLLRRLDEARRCFDDISEMDGIAGLQSQAMELITKGMADAFDLSKEDPRTVARYDTSSYYDPNQWLYEGGQKKRNNIPWYTAWDFHADVNNVAVPEGQKLVIAPFDHAVSAFIEDCEERGLSDEILLVCCGQMGRTPRINNRGGRDHWPRLAPLMLYGSGITDGQVVGRSSRDGAEAVGKPQTPDDLLATIFHTLFNYGEARLIPDLPTDLKQALEIVEKSPGVLGVR